MNPRTLFFRPLMWTLAVAMPIAACGASSNKSGDSFPPQNTSSSFAAAASSASSAAALNGFGDGGGQMITAPDPDAEVQQDDAAPPSDGPMRNRRCNDAGVCTCFNVASIGHRGVTGTSTNGMADNTTEFINWLNTESSTTVDLYETKPTLTADFLSNYDVIIIQWLSDGNGGPYWQFSAAEVSALGDWVNGGGGLITLSGYELGTGEIDPLNNLLSFSDISYNKDDVLTGCTGGQPCNCWGNTVPVGPWAPGPIGANLTQVGAYHGCSINPGSASVDASGTGPDGGNLVYAAHEAVGSGHIFAWADEWVTYTSQWLGVPMTATGGTSAQYAEGGSCYMMSAAQVFQVPQFWYNAIAYASSATQCTFTITNPTIIPR